MLIIFNDPAGITGRASHAWDPNITIQQNVGRHLQCGGDFEVRLNGETIDPRTDARMDALARPDDQMLIVRRPAGFDPVTWALIATAALAVYTYSLIPKPPTIQTPKDSPNNRLTGQTNVARAYQAIPDVYGYRRVWPDLIQPSLVEYENNVKQITEWLCISRGTGDISDVKYAETLLEDIEGATWDAFYPAASPSDYPELNSTTLNDVVEPFECPDVVGQELAPSGAYPSGIIRRGGELIYHAGDTFFTVKCSDSVVFDYLKSIAGTGTSGVEAAPNVDNPGFTNTTCNVLSATVSAGVVTFTFSNAPGLTAEYDDNHIFYFRPVGAPAPGYVGPFTLPVDCTRIRWNMAFPAGLSINVTVNVEWWKIDAAGAEIGGTRANQNVTYTSVSGFDAQFRTNEVIPAAGSGRYKVQFKRTTAAAGDGTDITKLESVSAIRTYSTKVLPGVTVIRVTTKATSGTGGLRDRKFNCRWQRKVRTLSSTSVSASRNFARAMAHAWCVAGGDIAQLDTAKLASINTALGETSDLLRFDACIDDADASLGERMQRIANAARCVFWRDGLLWTVARDEPRAAPELQLDYRNLAAGGDSQITYSAHLPASFDGVEVEYVDEASQSKKAYARLNISTGSVVTGSSTTPLKLKLPDCTTTAQALNRANLEARKLLYQRESITDTVLNDGGLLGVGSLVRWVDPNDFAGDDNLQAGEVLAIAGTTITTSEPIDWKAATTGRILLTGIDGKYLGAPVVCTPGAAPNLVILASAPSGLFLRSATRQLGSRYAFAVGLTEAELQAAGLYTVTEISPGPGRTFNVSAVQYDERVYNEDPAPPPAPTAAVGVSQAAAQASAAGLGPLWTLANLTDTPDAWYNETSAVTGTTNAAQWNDLSGNAFHLAQSTPGARPEIVSSGLNSMRTIRFDGVDDGLKFTSPGTSIQFQNSGAAWGVAVFKRLATDGVLTARQLFYVPQGTNAGNTRFGMALSVSAANQVGGVVRRLDADSAGTVTGPTVSDTSWHIFMFRCDWTNGDGFVDFDGGTASSNTSITSNGSTSNTPPFNAGAVGAALDGGTGALISFANMELAELALVDGALPAAGEVDKVFGHLAHKWGISSVLPGGHPYKTSPPTL